MLEGKIWDKYTQSSDRPRSCVENENCNRKDDEDRKKMLWRIEPKVEPHRPKIDDNVCALNGPPPTTNLNIFHLALRCNRRLSIIISLLVVNIGSRLDTGNYEMNIGGINSFLGVSYWMKVNPSDHSLLHSQLPL